MNKKIAIILAGLAVILAGIFGVSKMTSSNQENMNIKKGTLTVGLEGTYAPFSYHDDNGQLTGFEVEIARALAKKMDLKVNFVQSKWDSLIAGLNAKRYDAVINNIGITDERKANYRMSEAYLYPRAALIKRTGDSSLNQLSDIKNKTMAQSVTSNYGKKAKAEGANIKAVAGIIEAMNLVTTNRADGSLNDLGAFENWKQSNPDADVEAIDVSKAMGSTPDGVLMNKDNKKLQERLNKAMRELHEDGTLTKLSKKYFNQDLTKE
ncbi:transporter substrate-binding domain-containing protein [Fructobacillus sp. M1-13]|uniref:Transporter substrate-binding domain-containing protein n=1 Tax=Fructobacillus papyriferae TaxID=2713171 RepID=A0ABS5QQ66_9LACO|nr:transporter substrate-binding domain-containing protein [Fructobacillus papyriferae]MBS9335246.1 transporter substrate-binding domain-containing protein [Fructobacillus papyriferae]MCD2159085.1 transporter substrate-binding domain-containing protein [Fructobacillus papyriferae]